MYTAWPTGGDEVCRIGNERTTAAAATLAIRVGFEMFNKNPINAPCLFFGTSTFDKTFKTVSLLFSSNKLQFGFPFNVSRRLRSTSYIWGSRDYTPYFTLCPFFSHFCFYQKENRWKHLSGTSKSLASPFALRHLLLRRLARSPGWSHMKLRIYDCPLAYCVMNAIHNNKWIHRATLGSTLSIYASEISGICACRTVYFRSGAITR